MNYMTCSVYNVIILSKFVCLYREQLGEVASNARTEKIDKSERFRAGETGGFIDRT